MDKHNLSTQQANDTQHQTAVFLAGSITFQPIQNSDASPSGDRFPMLSAAPSFPRTNHESLAMRRRRVARYELRSQCLFALGLAAVVALLLF